MPFKHQFRVFFCALFLLSPVALAGKCPPCNSQEVGTDSCVFSCCLFQNCESPAGAGCVALCSYGFVLHKIFDADPPDEPFAPGFVTRTPDGDRRDECGLFPAVNGFIDLSGANEREVIEASIFDLDVNEFVGDGKGDFEVTFELMPATIAGPNAGLSAWRAIGEGIYDRERQSWVVYIDKTKLSRASDYIFRANFKSSDGHETSALAVGSFGPQVSGYTR